MGGIGNACLILHMLMIGSSAGVIGTEHVIELFFFSLCILVSHSAKKRDFAGVAFGLGLQSQQTWPSGKTR
jgi:hypothetical protein